MLWDGGRGRLSIQSQVLASLFGATVYGLPTCCVHSLQAREELKRGNDETLIPTPGVGCLVEML